MSKKKQHDGHIVTFQMGLNTPGIPAAVVSPAHFLNVYNVMSGLIIKEMKENWVDGLFLSCVRRHPAIDEIKVLPRFIQEIK